MTCRTCGLFRMYELSDKFPEKPSETAELNEEIDYTIALLDAVAAGIKSSDNQEIQALYVRIRELIETDRIREIRSAADEDARFGHKNVNDVFFGYKDHMAMSEEGIITAVEVTSGEVPDGKVMQTLAEKSKGNGVEVKEIIGDMAFVSPENLDYCENGGIDLIARTNSAVAAASEKEDDGFVYSKDAGTMQCPAGELAIRADRRAAKNGNTYFRYIFSKRKCKNCPLFDQCPVTKKTSEFAYNLTIPSQKNLERLEFEKSERFKQRLTIRHRIEEKHGEMKVAHGLRRAESTGLEAMRLQAYFTAFAVNVKRIARLASSFSPPSICKRFFWLHRYA